MNYFRFNGLCLLVCYRFKARLLVAIADGDFRLFVNFLPIFFYVVTSNYFRLFSGLLRVFRVQFFKVTTAVGGGRNSGHRGRRRSYFRVFFVFVAVVTGVQVGLALCDEASKRLRRGRGRRSSVNYLTGGGLLFRGGESSFSSLFVTTVTYKSGSAFRVSIVSFRQLPGLIVLLAVLRSYALRFLSGRLFLGVRVIARFVGEEVVVAWFRVSRTRGRRQVFQGYRDSSSFLGRIREW